MFAGLKVKGHRRAKPSTPYERPKGVVDKVRRWLSPSSWAGYFGSTSEQSDMETQTDQRPGVALPPSSKATFTDTSGGHSFTLMSNLAPPSDAISISKPKVDSFLLQDDFPASSSDMGEEKENLQNNSDDSWVAEDLGDEEEDANMEETVLVRPSSISLSCGSGMDSFDSGSGYESPSHTYQLGEGEVNVVQHSSLLLTPGAEAPVLLVTNPFFANQLPRVPLQVETSTVTASVPVSVSHTSQSSYNWSIPRPIGQAQGSQPSVTVEGQARGSNNVVATYTVTPQPIMASTVARTAKLHRTPSTYEPDGVTVREKRDKMMFMTTTSIVVTPSNQTTPSVDRSHMQATVSKSPAIPSSLLTRSSDSTNESLRLSPFHSPFYSGRTAYGGTAATQRMRLKRQRSSVEASLCVPVRVKVQPSNTPDKPPSLLSSTAKKIMDSLQSSGSPLKDARRLPMRQLSDEDRLPTKRRRVIDSPTGGGIVSPPPVTPLRSLQSSHHHLSTPSYSQSLPRSARQEELSSTRSSGSARVHSEAVSPASVLPVCSTMSSLPGSSSSVTSLKLPSFSSSTPKPSSVLSGLTFNPVSPAVEVQSHERSDKDELTQDKNSTSSSPSPGRGTGKLRVGKRSQHHFSRRTGEEEVDVGFVNPLPPPPSVGLQLTSTASFKFHAQSTTPLSGVKNIPLSTVMTPSVAPVSSQDSASLSFSPPKVASSVSSVTNQAVSSSFVFSVPKSHVLSPLVTFSTRDTPPSNTHTASSTSLVPKPAAMLGSQTPELSNLKAPHKFQSNYRGPSLIKPRPPPPIQKQPLPLLSGSVEDVLKSMSKAENSVLKKSSETETTKVGGDKEGILTKKIPNSSRTTDSSLAKFAPALGSWECDSCMVRNEAKSTSCVACSSPKPSAKPQSKAEDPKSSLADPKSSMAAKFAPPAGSWECETCMVPNKVGSNACIACSTPKPGSKGSSNSGSATLLAAKFAPPASSWECDTCMVVNNGMDTKCVACSTARPRKGISGVASKSSSSVSYLSTAKKSDKWTCDVCMIVNKAASLKCEACTNPRPGSSAVSSKFGSASSGLKLGDGGFKLGGRGLKFGNEGGLKLGDSDFKVGCDGGFNLGMKLGSGGGLKLGGVKLGSEGGIKLGSESGLKLGSEGGWKLGSEGGLKLGSEGGSKLGREGGLKLGSEGGWKLGSEGGLKLGSEGGSKLGSEGGWKLGSEGGWKLGSEGGLKLGSEGGSKLGREGGLKLGSEGGSKLGREGGLKLGSEGGSKLGREGGLKLGSEGGLKLGGEGGLKLGSEGGLKLGSEGGLKLGKEGGLKLGSEGGWKLGSEGGLKLGSEGGLKLGGEGGLKLGSEGGLKLGGEGGLKLGSEGGLKLGSEGGLKFGSEGGLKLGGEGSVKLGEEFKLGSAGGLKHGLKLGGNTGALQGSSSNSVGLSSAGGSILGSNNPGLFQSSTSVVTSSSLNTSGLKLGGGMSSSLFGSTQPSLSSTGASGNSQTLTSPSNKMDVGSENTGITMKGNGSSLQSQQLFGSSSLTTSASGLGTGLSLKFGSAQSAASVSLGSPFSFSATKSSASTPQGLGRSTASPFVFSSGNPSSSHANSQTSLGINNPLLSSGGSLFQASTAAQTTPVFAFKGASAQSASGPPNVNPFPSGGSLLSFSTSAPAPGKLQGLTFTPVGVSSAPLKPSFQFGSSSTGGLALGGTPGPSLGSGQNLFGSSGGPFQSSQHSIFGSTSSANVQAPPTFNFGSSIPVLGGSTPNANPSSLPASPVPAVFQFEPSGSPSFNFSAGSNATTASKADLKRRVIKKAARRIKN